MVDPTDSPVDPSDTMLPHYLIATWAKVCQAMGPEFEPYLPVVMPPLFRAANAKADVSVYGSYSSLAFISAGRGPTERRGRGRPRVERRLGHNRDGRTAGRHPDVRHRRKMPGVRDPRDLLLDARSAFRAVPPAEPRDGAPIATIRPARRRAGSMCNVRRRLSPPVILFLSFVG